MFLPETYQLTLALMILSMLCWGSWANTLKLCPNFRVSAVPASIRRYRARTSD